jgi:hypothetical protein
MGRAGVSHRDALPTAEKRREYFRQRWIAIKSGKKLRWKRKPKMSAEEKNYKRKLWEALNDTDSLPQSTIVMTDEQWLKAKRPASSITWNDLNQRSTLMNSGR